MCELGNLIEVMSCTGGCLGGNSTFNGYKYSSKQLKTYVDSSKSITKMVDV